MNPTTNFHFPLARKKCFRLKSNQVFFQRLRRIFLKILFLMQIFRQLLNYFSFFLFFILICDIIYFFMFFQVILAFQCSFKYSMQLNVIQNFSTHAFNDCIYFTVPRCTKTYSVLMIAFSSEEEHKEPSIFWHFKLSWIKWQKKDFFG